MLADAIRGEPAWLKEGIPLYRTGTVHGLKMDAAYLSFD
jgi:hypothetical protein